MRASTIAFAMQLASSLRAYGKRRHPERGKTKTAVRRNPTSGRLVQELRGLLDNLALPTANTVQVPCEPGTIDNLGVPTDLHRRAFDLLQIKFTAQAEC